MLTNIEQIPTDELKNLFIGETSHFMKAVNEGASFDQLKEIRLKIREIETEIKKRN